MALGHKKAGPIDSLREHITTYMYWVKVGKSKFQHKKEVGQIFLEMESTEYLLQQATSGTMYDYRRRLERNVWAGAVNKYDQDMQHLKEALLRAVDACDADPKGDHEKAAEKFAEEEAERKRIEKLPIREQMAIAEKKEAEEAKLAAARAEEAEESGDDEEEEKERMTEEDCRELWRIYQGLASEYKAMKEQANKWMAENPEKGCLGVTLMLLALPVAAAYGVWQIF